MRTDPDPFPQKFITIYTSEAEMHESEFYDCDNVRQVTITTVEFQPYEFELLRGYGISRMDGRPVTLKVQGKLSVGEHEAGLADTSYMQSIPGKDLRYVPVRIFAGEIVRKNYAVGDHLKHLKRIK